MVAAAASYISKYQRVEIKAGHDKGIRLLMNEASWD